MLWYVTYYSKCGQKYPYMRVEGWEQYFFIFRKNKEVAITLLIIGFLRREAKYYLGIFGSIPQFRRLQKRETVVERRSGGADIWISSVRVSTEKTAWRQKRWGKVNPISIANMNRVFEGWVTRNLLLSKIFGKSDDIVE